ncbi:MAG: hypothetical protein IJ521_07965, partial [Schwartzia sp.]|nr:hypothetical protein [Schwartzia sp. (in: firmicutes)]
AADTAILQIKEKQYCRGLENFAGKVLLVGISYDKETKAHSCVIKEWELSENICLDTWSRKRSAAQP